MPAGGEAAFWLVMWFTAVQAHVPPEALNRLHAYDMAGSLLMVAAAVIDIGVVAVLLVARPIRRLKRAGLV